MMLGLELEVGGRKVWIYMGVIFLFYFGLLFEDWFQLLIVLVLGMWCFGLIKCGLGMLILENQDLSLINYFIESIVWFDF